ncbi:MAG: aminopeptidase P family protein [Dehalococcoidales bacterium]|nr:aminopeptidase P family protein [Dehalococcoidales bacterium]
MEIEKRIAALRRDMPARGVDAVWVSQPDNLFYLSGCEGLEGYLLLTPEKAVIATDFRYVEQAERQSAGFEIFCIKGRMAEWLPELVKYGNLRKLGFEGGHLSFASYQMLGDILKSSALPIELVPLDGLVETVRVVKEEEETGYIIKAAAITASALDYVERVLRPGVTEEALAWEIEKFMRDSGSQQLPFDPIVAAGPNSALPHARPSGRAIRAGEPVVVDIGSKYSSYSSDMTRTFCIGEKDDVFKKVYAVVLEAQMEAISGIKAGMTGSEADAIARGVITRAGYGEAFGHSLGHGIGLVVHEKPGVGPNSTDILANGMVFTVEPGIYISGWGGVRIEDDVVMENNSLRVISSARK